MFDEKVREDGEGGKKAEQEAVLLQPINGGQKHSEYELKEIVRHSQR